MRYTLSFRRRRNHIIFILFMRFPRSLEMTIFMLLFSIIPMKEEFIFTLCDFLSVGRNDKLCVTLLSFRRRRTNIFIISCDSRSPEMTIFMLFFLSFRRRRNLIFTLCDFFRYRNDSMSLHFVIPTKDESY